MPLMFSRVPFPLAPFGAIASLSSERNAVSKSSALTMNPFPLRCASTQKSAWSGQAKAEHQQAAADRACIKTVLEANCS
jgi:hypothetical protein